MKGKKIEILREELFKNSGAYMALCLETSGNKISLALNGKQKLTIESIAILLTKYYVSPHWLFGEDEEEPLCFTELAFNNKKYIDLLEKHTVALERLSECQSKQIAVLKISQTSNDI